MYQFITTVTVTFMLQKIVKFSRCY